MSTTLNGMFSKPKPHRIDFIKENKKKLREISTMVNQPQNKSRFDITKSKSSQTAIRKRESSTGLKENNSSTASGCHLSTKGSMAVFLQERRDKGSVSNASLSAKQRSSHRSIMQKNQSCQTINPKRCDELYHQGVIKYPSNKVLQALAEIEKKKQNRLDAHIKKEYYRRNKVKEKRPNKMAYSESFMVTGKGDSGENANKSDSEGEEERVSESEPDLDPDLELESKESSEILNKPVKQPQHPLTMSAAEIIRRTTEDHISPRKQINSSHTPNSKGDAKSNKKPPKKPQKEEDLLKTVLDPQCPPGHIPLPDMERKKTLHMLRVSHAELVRELNLLPVRTDTLRVRQRKIHLENQLNKIEEGIKVFNKSKVYVKIEE